MQKTALFQAIAFKNFKIASKLLSHENIEVNQGVRISILVIMHYFNNQTVQRVNFILYCVALL